MLSQVMSLKLGGKFQQENRTSETNENVKHYNGEEFPEIILSCIASYDFF